MATMKTLRFYIIGFVDSLLLTSIFKFEKRQPYKDIFFFFNSDSKCLYQAQFQLSLRPESEALELPTSMY